MARHARLNRILMTSVAAALTLLTLLTPLAASASEPPHAADEKESSITLPVTQIWTITGTGADLSATYELTPKTESHQDGYTSNTAQAITDGLITYQIGTNDPNEGTFKLTGDKAKTDITFTWTSPGLYVFTLKSTSTDKEHYSYDKGTYLIRVYVRSDNQSFITAQYFKNGEIDDTSEDGKVAEIVFDPRYSNPREPGHHHDDTTPTTPVNTIDETGDLPTDETTPVGPEEIHESGDNTTDGAGPLTGDESNITLYGLLVLMATAGLATWTRRQHS